LLHTRQKDTDGGVTVDTIDLHAESAESQRQGRLDASADIFSNMAPAASPNLSKEGSLLETWLVLEYCDRGPLSEAVQRRLLINQETKAPLLDHVLLSALDVANAMNYLHSLDITHGDLKAENVLLKSTSTDRRGYFCKVSDFGLSRYVGHEDYLQTFTYGTITHMPPEVLKNGHFSTKVDVYSFGVFLWELLSTERPYPDKTHGEILMTVIHEERRPQITDQYPQMYADLIKECWRQNPEDRPRFGDIVNRLKGMLTNLELGNSPWTQVNAFGEQERQSRRSQLLSLPNEIPRRSFSNTFSTTRPSIHDTPEESFPLSPQSGSFLTDSMTTGSSCDGNPDVVMDP